MGNRNSSTNTYCCECWNGLWNPRTFKKSTLNLNHQLERKKFKNNIALELQNPKENLTAPLMNDSPALTADTNNSHVKPKTQKRVTKDDFTFIRVLGRGSFGKVYLVKKKDNNKYYALKSLKKEDVINKNQKQNAMTEKNVLQSANFPFIVRLKYSFQSESMLYFVMDYLPGGELFHHLRKMKKFSEETARFYAAEVILALEYLHNELNIIYRDLKPENILLDVEGHLKLADFGLAKASGRTFSFCGTPEYLAPEILKKSGYKKEVDWWSLGCLIYEMLAGYPPFQSRQRKELFNMILTMQPIMPSHFSPKAQDIIKKLLVRDPNSRLGSGSSEEIKNHPFFADVNWELYLKKKVKPPIKPHIERMEDTTNFDPHFTREPLEETPSSIPSDFQRNLFRGFTYQEHAIQPDTPLNSYDKKPTNLFLNHDKN